MLRHDSFCNASIFVVKNPWGKLPIQWQEPIPCPRNTELSAQTIDDETSLRVKGYDRMIGCAEIGQGRALNSPHATKYLRRREYARYEFGDRVPKYGA